jgi:hypothetical protein
LSMAGASFLTFLIVPALLRKVDTRLEAAGNTSHDVVGHQRSSGK